MTNVTNPVVPQLTNGIVAHVFIVAFQSFLGPPAVVGSCPQHVYLFVRVLPHVPAQNTSPPCAWGAKKTQQALDLCLSLKSGGTCSVSMSVDACGVLPWCLRMKTALFLILSGCMDTPFCPNVFGWRQRSISVSVDGHCVLSQGLCMKAAFFVYTRE